MSLFKAFSMELDPDLYYQDLKESFLDVIYSTEKAGTVTKDDVVALVSVYASVGALYMWEVAVNLEDVPELKESMKFMNSFIAEAVGKAGLHYFEAEQGYSIVDKAVQQALDNNGVASVEAIEGFINEIEESYKEDELDD
jgi:hypothetical protein